MQYSSSAFNCRTETTNSYSSNAATESTRKKEKTTEIPPQGQNDKLTRMVTLLDDLKKAIEKKMFTWF